jgi:hypothetical protein
MEFEANVDESTNTTSFNDKLYQAESVPVARFITDLSAATVIVSDTV